MGEWVGQVNLINVGNGDAILVEVPDKDCHEGKFIMIIDGGSGEASEYENQSTGRIRAVDYLKKKGIGHIDVMVNTHIHEDHTCGLIPIAERWIPGELWQIFPKDVIMMMKQLTQKAQTESEGKFIAALNDFRKLCKLVEDRGGRVIQMMPHHTGRESLRLAKGVYVKILGPERQDLDRQIKWMKELYQEGNTEVLPLMDKHMNCASMLQLLNCGGKTFLLTGDMENTCYKGCMQDIKAEVFKIGHHGQINSLTQEILHAVSPQFAAICVSSDRRYQSADPRILRMLHDAKVPVYYSDCPEIPPYTDGIKPHQAVVFRVMKDGALCAFYENIIQ